MPPGWFTTVPPLSSIASKFASISPALVTLAAADAEIASRPPDMVPPAALVTLPPSPSTMPSEPAEMVPVLTTVPAAPATLMPT